MRAKGPLPKDDKWKSKYVEPEPVNTDDLPELPEGWAWASVEETGQVDLGRMRSPDRHTGANDKPYLRVKNVFEDRIDIADVMTMHFSREEFDFYRLKHGDVLLNEGQSKELVGGPAMFRDELPEVAFNNSLGAERPRPEVAATAFGRSPARRAGPSWCLARDPAKVTGCPRLPRGRPRTEMCWKRPSTTSRS